jgi:dihydroflavonol-4-reductase
MTSHEPNQPAPAADSRRHAAHAIRDGRPGSPKRASVETALGDVTDHATVERALEGCDAFLHAASVFSTDARRAEARLPWQGEGIWVMNCAARCDDSRTRSEFGVESRPLRETIADTVRWLVEVGHISPAEAGRLADAPE